jgi:hypothetical protein
MRILLLIFSLFICSLASSQNDLISLKISPSFHKSAQLRIFKYNSKYKMSLIGEQVNETVSIKNESISRIIKFIPVYIIGIERLDSIEKAEYLEMSRKGIFKLTTGTDGITVQGTLQDQQKMQLIKFRSPQKENINYMLMMLLFNQMRGEFKKKQTEKYIGILNSYF